MEGTNDGRFLPGKSGGQKKVDEIFKVMKGKNCHQKHERPTGSDIRAILELHK